MSRRRPKTQPVDHNCGVCAAPAVDAFVCRACMDRYHGQLAAIPDLARDLRIEHARLAVKGGAVTGRGTAEQPLPYVPAASDALHAIRNTLATACRALAIGAALPPDRISAMCAWLARHEAAIPLRPEGPDIVAEMDTITRGVIRVIDNPPEIVMRGKCFCGAELRAPRSATVIRCRQCGEGWRGEEADAYTQSAIVEHLAPWEELEDYALKALRIPRGTLDSWQRRGRIRPASSAIDGQRLYRVGDLLNLDEQRRSRAS